MGLFHLFWDLNQEQRIRDAQTAADRNTHTAQSAQQSADELRAAVDRLSLLNQAIWELVRERTNLTDADLNAKVDEVDSRDGAVDGRMASEAAPCPKCRRPNATWRARCLYCGTATHLAAAAR